MELNADRVDKGIQSYVSYQVQKLALLHGYDANTTRAIEQAICVGANCTFLWASLVCKRLENVSASEAVFIVKETPPELERLYEQVYANPCSGPKSNSERSLSFWK